MAHQVVNASALLASSNPNPELPNCYDLGFFEEVDPWTLEVPEDDVSGLTQSLAEVGLLEAPLVCGKTVLEGKRRVLAYRQMGMNTITVRQVPPTLAAVAPLHYRLARRHTTVVDIAKDVFDWKTKYEAQFPLAKNGGNSKLKKQTGIIPFWKHLQQYTKWSQTKIEQLVKIGSMPVSDLEEARKNEHLANDHVKLLALARFKPMEHLGKTVTKQELIEGVAAHPTWPIAKIVKHFNWSKPTPAPAEELIPGIPPLYCGDFEEVMMTLPEKSVQLVLVDPLWQLEWAHNLPRLAKQIYRILIDDGAAIVFYCSNRVNRVIRALDDVFGEDAYFAKIIDDQGDGTPQPFNPHGYQDKYKNALMYVKGKRHMDGTMSNIFRSKELANKGAYQYGQSLELFEYLIRFGSQNVSDTVLDCCVGGGTSMIAALNTGRKFIGIDIDPNALNICKQVYAEWLNNKNGKEQ